MGWLGFITLSVSSSVYPLLCWAVCSSVAEYICPSVGPLVIWSVCQLIWYSSVCLLVHWSVGLQLGSNIVLQSVCSFLFVGWSVDSSGNPFIQLSNDLSNCSSVFVIPSLCFFAHLSVRPSICLSFRLPIRQFVMIFKWIFIQY